MEGDHGVEEVESKHAMDGWERVWMADADNAQEGEGVDRDLRVRKEEVVEGGG
jgi:hypothetical protein